eukprot:6214605-Pleurochrysis_carterae.AAC.3
MRSPLLHAGFYLSASKMTLRRSQSGRVPLCTNALPSVSHRKADCSDPDAHAHYGLLVHPSAWIGTALNGMSGLTLSLLRAH